MEGGHLLRTGRMAAVAFHLAIQSVGQYEMMGHGDAMGLHGVGRAVVEVTHVGLVEVRHSLLRRRRHVFFAVGRTRVGWGAEPGWRRWCIDKKGACLAGARTTA